MVGMGKETETAQEPEEETGSGWARRLGQGDQGSGEGKAMHLTREIGY